MKTFKEFSLNIIPKGHKMVKILQSKEGEVMITKKDNKFNIMFDNQTVDTEDNERDAMKSARNFIKMMNKSKGSGGMSTKNIGGKRSDTGGYFK